jgi:hypothetical protein
VSAFAPKKSLNFLLLFVPPRVHFIYSTKKKKKKRKFQPPFLLTPHTCRKERESNASVKLLAFPYLSR